MYRIVGGNVDGIEEDDGYEDCAEGGVARMHAPAHSTGECATNPNRKY